MCVISSYRSMTTMLSYRIANLKWKNANMYLKACHFKSCTGIFEEAMVTAK